MMALPHQIRAYGPENGQETVIERRSLAGNGPGLTIKG